MKLLGDSFSFCSFRVTPWAALLCLAGQASAGTFFVRDGAPAGGTGLSWASPFNSVRAALAAAAPGDQIRVGAGSYLPAAGRTSSFVVSGITLLGGFPALGGPLSSRDPVLNPTILSGDIGVPADVTDNVYHVVVASACLIDGFIIEGGNANGAPSHLRGGGVYATGTLTISHCKIQANKAASGGGVYYTTNTAGNSLTLDLCTLFANDALGSAAAGFGEGGGLLTYSQEYVGSVIVDQCSFLGNTALSVGGGAKIAMEMHVTNSVFSGNEAVAPGGALHASAPSIALGFVQNCTFANNHSDYFLGAGGLFLSHVQLVNSILWSNDAGAGAPPLLDQQLLATLSTVDFCDTEGGVFPAGAGNKAAYPWFSSPAGVDGMVGTTDDNLHLLGMSSCLDAGDNARAAIPLDLDGNTRIQKSKIAGGVVVDMGAYERTWILPPAGRVIVP